MRDRPVRLRSPLLRALVLALPLLHACADAPREAARAGVLLLSLDTLRADHLGAWGNPAGTSPHLDRLARRGAMFRSCIAQAASTLPSHLSMFQSRPASLAGPAHPMLAEILGGAGWTTVAFTGGGNISGELGFGRGFTRYEENRSGLAWATPELAAWLAGEDRGPFFAFVHTYDPHVPYDPPRPWDTLYSPDYTGGLTGATTREFCRNLRGLEADDPAPPVAESERRRLRALYAGGVRHTDALVGELVRELEREGLWARTLAVVMSDHGEELWDHGTVLHSHTVYQELVHVPLIVREPDSGRGGVLAAETVRNVDIAPTILALLGLQEADSHRGVSLVPRLRGEGGPPLPAVSEMNTQKSILDGPWKFIAGGEPTWALYDLRRDPGETRNVADRHPGLVREYRRALAGLGGVVRELSPKAPTPELAERLRALGYID